MSTPESSTEMPAFRCGFVAVVGRPNVGKSTLVNRLVGDKISITSRRPQTTRHRILGIKSSPHSQTIYVDTPGIRAGAKGALNRHMNRAADNALADLHAAVFVIDALRWADDDERVTRKLRHSRAPVIVAINKVDRIRDKSALLPFLAEVSARGDFAEVIPISARRGTNVAALEERVTRLLPEGPARFPSDQTTNRSERFLAAELVREKLIQRLGQELPYRLGVEIEHFETNDDLSRIDAVIWVERAGHKPIVVGGKGAVLKAAGTRARRDMERMFGRRVHLQLWVKVKQGWSNDERALLRLGYVDGG